MFSTRVGAQILAEKNLRVGAFGKVEAQEDQASWKIRPNAQQSPQVLNLKKRMEQRKRHMKIYTKNHTFVDIFKETEERRAPVSHVVAGTIELVARDVIDKNAEIQHREKKGVWAQLGKPYACFGVPAPAIPRDCPMPVGTHAGEIHSFLGHTQKKEELEVGKDTTKLRRRPRSVTTSESLNMQGMLIKLGQQGSTKFPRQPLIVANDLKTSVKFGGCYTVGASIGSRGHRSRGDGKSRLSLDLSELFESWRSASGGSQSVMDMDFSGAPPPPPPPRLSVRDSIKSLPQLAASPIPQAERPSTSDGTNTLLYDWKKQFADMRKRLLDNLNKRIMARTVRRKHCRSCSPFTAELSGKLMSHLEERGSTKTPVMTGHIWKSVEEKQALERAASSSVDPEVENISKFYERTCAFVNNQKMDDPLMDMLVAYLKELLEDGHRLQKSLLVALCERLSLLEDHVHATGRMACLMPILNFICKELRLSSAEFNIILNKFGLDWYNSFTRPSLFVSPQPS